MEGEQESRGVWSCSGQVSPTTIKEQERAEDEAARQSPTAFRRAPPPRRHRGRSHLQLGAVPHAGPGGGGALLHGQGGCRAAQAAMAWLLLASARLGSARCPAPPLRAPGRCAKAETPRGSPDAPPSHLTGVRGEIKDNAVPKRLCPRKLCSTQRPSGHVLCFKWNQKNRPFTNTSQPRGAAKAKYSLYPSLGIPFISARLQHFRKEPPCTEQSRCKMRSCAAAGQQLPGLIGIDAPREEKEGLAAKPWLLRGLKCRFEKQLLALKSAFLMQSYSAIFPFWKDESSPKPIFRFLTFKSKSRLQLDQHHLSWKGSSLLCLACDSLHRHGTCPSICPEAALAIPPLT